MRPTAHLKATEIEHVIHGIAALVLSSTRPPELAVRARPMAAPTPHASGSGGDDSEDEMPEMCGKTAPGIQLLRQHFGDSLSPKHVRSSVLVLTFLSYAAYHGARKPPSIVKSVLHPSHTEKSALPAPPQERSHRRRLRVNEVCNTLIGDTRFQSHLR